MFQYIIKCINAFISFVLFLALLLAGAYAAYCLWDNFQIDTAAASVREELLTFKPGEAGQSACAFQELKAINPDVCAWVTLDNTRVDYPVLQGETNIDYINTDVYGNFALAGSIFLDARNQCGFSDLYSILYGHHMESGAMFGDLDLYKEKAFFESNQTGTLVLSGHAYSLRVFACMVVRASEKSIFDPSQWNESVSGLLDYVEEEALHIDKQALEPMRMRIDEGADVQILAFTTCSSEFADARTVVLAEMRELHREAREDVIP